MREKMGDWGACDWRLRSGVGEAGWGIRAWSVWRRRRRCAIRVWRWAVSWGGGGSVRLRGDGMGLAVGWGR